MSKWMGTSPSRIETMQICARKWWFQFIRKLPRIAKMKFGFGTAMHGAIERYLRGEDELFPEGWNFDKDAGENLPPAESALIQVLVREGISNGTIERRPDSEIEREIKMQIIDGVSAQAFIDHLSIKQARVEDHKSSKSKRYFKSVKKLKESIQMMFYAFWLLKEYERLGQVPPRIITLCHNQFLKDFESPEVRRREAEVTPKEVETFWNDVIVTLVKEMQIIALKEDWKDIPDPDSSACAMYGGCDFLTICGGQESMVEYERRIRRLNNKNREPEVTKVTTPEDFLKRRAAKKGVETTDTTSVNPPAEPAAEAPAKTEKKAEAVATSGQGAPPWTNPECPQCSRTEHPGFNKSGKPCRICLAVTGQSTNGYEWSVEDGKVSWWKEGEKVAEQAAVEAKDGGSKTEFAADDFLRRIKAMSTVGGVEEVMVEASEILADEDLAVVAQAASKRIEKLEEPAPAPKAEEKPAPTPVEAKKPAAAKAEEKPKELPAKDVSWQNTSPATPGGLTLMIGCAPIKWTGKVILAEDILAQVGGYWAEAAVFDRRAKLRNAILAGGEFVDQLKGCTVVQTGRDPDVDNLMSALVTIADRVIRGTIQ